MTVVIKKISTNLLRLGSTGLLRFHIGLYDNEENKPRDVIYTYFDEYVHININAYMSLDIKEKNVEYDPSRSIMITETSIVNLIKCVQTVVDNIYKKDTFEISQGRTVISKESIEENKCIMDIGKSIIEIRPAVIYDPHEDTYYEGATIYLNKMSNFIELHFLQLEALLRKLKQIDFTVYGLQLFNFYMASDEFKQQMTTVKSTYKKKTNVFAPQKTEQEQAPPKVSGGIPEKKDMNDFFN